MKLRTILLTLGLLALFSVIASGLLYYSSLQASALHNAEAMAVHHTEKIKSLISSYLSDNQKAVRALAGLKELQRALTDPNANNLSEANLILDHFNDSLKVSVSYLMDRNGKTIASSNRHDKRSFVGKNYSFRPYFKEAIHKKPSVYMALGVTSKKRGVYYSHPVYSSTPGTPIGVVVLKSGVDTIEEEFISLQNYSKEMMTFITGTHGVVFMSDYKDFLYSLLWQVSDEKLVEVLNTKQFGKGPWDWAGFKRKNENRVVDKAGNEYVMFQKPIESLSGWNVVHLHNIRMLSKTIAAPFIGTIGYIILVLCVLISLSVFILYNIGKSDIIKRLEAEKALRESEKEYRSTLNNLLIGVVVHASDTSILLNNPEATNILGLTDEQMAGKKAIDPSWNFVHEDSTIMKAEDYPVSKVFSSKKPIYDYIIGINRPDRDYVTWVIVNAIPIFSDDSELEKVIVNFVDITARKQAEEAIKRSASLQSKMVANIGDVIAIIGQDSINKYKSPNIEKLFGWKPEEVVGASAWENVHPEDLESAQKFFGTLMHEPNAVGTTECRYKRKDGSYRWIEFKGSNLLHDPDIRGLVGNYHDITDRKQADENLLTKQYYLSKAQEIGKIGTWELDIQKNILIWTDENYKIFGVPIGTKLSYEIFLNCIHPDDRDYVNKKWSEALNNRPYDIMHRLIVDDKVKWVREKADIEFDTDGKPIIAIGFTQDLTDLKKVEDALHESEEKFKTLYDNAPLSYQSLDENGNFVEVNETWLKVLGYEKEEVVGNNFSEFLHPEWKAHFKENFPRFKAIGEVLGVEFEMVKKDGSMILVSFHGKIGHRPDGSFKQTHCVFRNITDQRRVEEEKQKLESQLQQAQKMESIGTLAGGIAHDFNNILTSVIGFTELSLNDTEKGSLLQSNLQEVLIAAQRAADLVKQILAFSRQADQEKKPIQLKLIVKEVLKLIRASIPSIIEIEQSIQSNPTVMGASTQLHQILMNLCTNAAHAMEDKGGVLTVNLSDIELDSEFTSNYPDLKPGPYTTLTVNDTGIGMSPDVMEKIFDPFFTTKAKGEGTGMGLSVVHGIVLSHGGNIYVYSEPGKGSTFKVFLPVIDRRLKPEDRIERPIPTGTERILFIDDEPAIAKMSQQSLKSLGYDVVIRTSSIEALDFFNEQSERIDIVITDLTMPKMTGEELAQNFLKIRSDIPIILCTGFSAKIDKDKAMSMGIRALVSKPVLKREIAEVVRAILDS